MKKMGLFCFLCSLFLAIVFYQSFLTLLANGSIHAYSVSKWGKPLEYDKLYVTGNRLVILQPHFKNGPSFSAEQMIVDFHFDWWKRHLYIDIDIQQPHWHLQPTFSSQPENWDKFLGKEEKWIKVYPSFRVKTGLLTWAIVDSSRYDQLYFDLEANSEEGGFIKLYFDPQDLNSDCLVLQASSAVEGMEVNCSCQKVSCPSLYALGQLLGVNFPSWSVTSGFLQGQLKAIFPGKQRPYLEGELFIEGLAFNQLETPLKGHVEQARLKLEKNQIAYEFNDQVPTCMGQLDILKPASLTYLSPLQEWKINQIEGSIKLNNIETALIDLKAQVGNHPHLSNWHLLGEANLNAHRSFNFDLSLLCSSSGKPDGKIHLSFSQLQKGSTRAEVQLNKVSPTECDFLQTLLAAYWPVFKEIKLEKGELNAVAEGDFTDLGIGELHINQFQAFNLCFKLKSWNARCNFNQVSGQGKVYLGREDFWQSLDAGLNLEEGEIQFEGVTPHLPLTNIQAHLHIQEGQIEHSLITLKLAGLRGKMDVEWGDHKQLLTFKLDGIVQDLAELLPTVIQERLRQNIFHNRVMILANIKRQNQQVELAGTLHIQQPNTDQVDLIHFGCELKKISHHPAPKFVPVGWFHGRNLPLDKFLSPFIFGDGTLSMSGEAEFKGSFDDQYLALKYEAENLKIENENLCIEINQLHSDVPGQLIGSHQFNLTNYSHHGTLPVQKASYFEKNSGLVFQGIQGVVEFNNQTLRMMPCEAYCEGIYFVGDMELDYSDPVPGVFKLAVNCPILSAKISQIQHLLASLDQTSILYKIPIEGEISAKKEGLKLDYTFSPKGDQLQLDIRGAITDGSLPFEGTDITLREIYMDFDYRHQQKLLEFSDIQGTLLVGKARRIEEYLFTGRHLRFYNLGNVDIDLDIAVNDHENELLRLVGYTQEEKEGAKSLHLNQNISHISSIYPHVFQCRLKDWSCIEQFEFRSQFNLGIFLQDLKLFRQTGLLFLSHSMIEKLSQSLPVEGQGLFAVHYYPHQSYAFQLEGSHIKQGNSSEHYGLLKGSKQDKKWMIDQLQWDDLNAYADLQQTADGWKIPFLGLKAGQTLLLGLEGDFIPVEGILRAKLNFCEVNLAKLERCAALHSFVTKWQPKGHLKATGDIEWSCLSSDPWEGFKASLQTEIDDLAFRDYPLQVLEPFHMELDRGQSFRLQNVQLELSPQNSQAYIDLQRFEYLSLQDSRGLQFAFEIPSSQLERVGQSLHHHFPDILNASVKDILIESKQQGQLKGKLTVENNPASQNSLQLILNDGIYRFKKREYDLKQFDLQITGDELRFSALSQQERCPFQIVGQTHWPSCKQGQFTLIHSEVFQTSLQPLVVKWENDPQRGWLINSLQGEFSGCSFLLCEDKESMSNHKGSVLQGKVSIDLNRLCPLLTTHMAEAIKKFKMGSSYSLDGHFWINPDWRNTLLETVSFKGTLASKEAILKGYQVQSLQADLQYVPGRLDMQNFSIQDPAGEARAASIIATLDQTQDRWMLFVPRLTVKNFRLFLLRDAEFPDDEPHSKFHSLIVKRVDLQNFAGELNKQLTWQAEGNLHFFNPSRKNLSNPFLAIPAEIIMRWGLDPQVLNPVTGIIYFNLQGDRFYLTRFKDVFSEGRGSKFYLAQGRNPSWIDFDGNLSVQVRMKQYNLIFKIAELFTLSIQGNIKKPRYTLQKQSKTSHKIQPLSALSIEN